MKLDIILFFYGVGLVSGMVLVSFLWRIKIREKAASGFRLECGGRLYDIRESDNET